MPMLIASAIAVFKFQCSFPMPMLVASVVSASVGFQCQGQFSVPV